MFFDAELSSWCRSKFLPFVAKSSMEGREHIFAAAVPFPSQEKACSEYWTILSPVLRPRQKKDCDITGFFGLVQDKEKRRQIRIFSAVKHDSFRGKRRIWKQLVSSANARGSGYCGDWRAKATSWPLLVPFWSSSSDLRTIEHRCWDTANTGVLGKCLPAWTLFENYAKSLICIQDIFSSFLLRNCTFSNTVPRP